MRLRLLYEDTRPAGWKTQGKFSPSSSDRLSDMDNTLWQGTVDYLPYEHLMGDRGETGKEADELIPFPFDPWSRQILKPETQVQSLLAHYKGEAFTFSEILGKLKPYLLKLSKAGYDMNYRNDYITALNGLIDKEIVAKDTSERPSKFNIAQIDVTPTADIPKEKTLSSRMRKSSGGQWSKEELEKHMMAREYRKAKAHAARQRDTLPPPK